MNKFSIYFTYAIILLVISAVIVMGVYLSIMLLPLILVGMLVFGIISWFVNYKQVDNVKVVYKEEAKKTNNNSNIIDAEYEIIDKE